MICLLFLPRNPMNKLDVADWPTLRQGQDQERSIRLGRARSSWLPRPLSLGYHLLSFLLSLSCLRHRTIFSVGSAKT